MYLDGAEFVSQRLLRQFDTIAGGTVPDLRGLFLRGHGSQSHTQNNGLLVQAFSRNPKPGMQLADHGQGERARMV
jgi:hypothetical protein